MSFSMNRDIAIKWIERLESLPEEAQGVGALNDNGKMCCLGVLSEIAYENGVIEKRANEHGVSGYGDFGDMGEYNYYYLPGPVVTWAGIESENPDSQYGGETNHNPHFQGKYAAIWNDEERLSFKEIADLLRKEFDLPK